MNIEEFRTYCLSFKGVHDKMPFERATSEYDKNLLVFYVMDKWFCFVNVDAFDCCNIKCKPERIEALQDRFDSIKPGYHMNKRHWISVYFNNDVPDKMIKELVKQSYDIVVASLSKKEKEELDAMSRNVLLE
ncbi:MmcQ/YjbR family DNA-binding protein [uncultured Bacteroides sp.]|uniref:MmcQ/YjbR family DNA-binding protein n=1 Tax=uncultured Bacteroides sp. TaxID=162156 RepID=UPI0025DA4204|nr:MmcQ/YjbR family DNA-binding protein [uncultured Bacteroides sp.]